MSGAPVSLRWVVAVVVCAWLASVAQAAESVWDALRAPGAVVLLRHSFAPGGFDPPGARLDDCSTQRNLDESGRAQAYVSTRRDSPDELERRCRSDGELGHQPTGSASGSAIV